MFNWAIREGYDIPGNPVFGSNRPPEPKSRERVLADSELAAIWRACGNQRHPYLLLDNPLSSSDVTPVTPVTTKIENKR
jgi:hypothetical protein